MLFFYMNKVFNYFIEFAEHPRDYEVGYWKETSYNIFNVYEGLLHYP